MTLGRVLVVAGSDSSGGAGLEADQKVIAAHGCYAMTATTALTAQNTQGVWDIHSVPAGFVGRQIDACVEDIGVDVVKTGMLASAETIQMLAEQITKHKLKKVVVDPVMIATSGAKLVPGGVEAAVRELKRSILPVTMVLTPNIPEAEALLVNSSTDGEHVDVVVDFSTPEELENVARRIRDMGPEWVLIKGGHGPFTQERGGGEKKNVVVDVLVGPDGFVRRFEREYQETRNTHGTGCSLASAIASNMSKGLDVPTSVRAAGRYIEAAIRTALGFGKGHGPLNHFHSIYTLPFSPGFFIEYLLEREDVKPVWQRFVHHPFVMAMGDGSLPVESFKGYIIQDYLYLIHYARASALAAYKSTNMEEISRSNEIVGHIMRETKLHINYCQSFNISLSQMENTQEHQACTAYTRYVLETGQSQDWLSLQMAMAPCLLGYGAVATMLRDHPDTIRDKKENMYWPWIENYVAFDYIEAVRLGSELLEKYIVQQSPSRIEELVKIFIHATQMEIGFWEMFPYK